MRSILVVDDSGFARRTLRQILEPAGFRVQEARDGPEAVEKYEQGRPDLMVLDVVMGGMDGLEVLRKLREMDPGAEIVIGSADVQTATEMEARSLGAAGYLHKPFNQAEVLGTIAKVLAGAVR